ncbi:MAG: GNAT family N-acetyltransferase [Pseudoflavonifractor sp.]|nr:GNAT family N-acetyltransferase [Pseudoflavonifractor sp.]
MAWEVFGQFEAPDYTSQGTETFYASIHDPNYLALLCIYGAFDGDALIGILATRSGGAHIALFFVRNAYHRQGVGRQRGPRKRKSGSTAFEVEQ